MKLLKVDPEAALDALRALTMVATAAKGGLGRPQQAVLDAVKLLLLEMERVETERDVPTLAAITPEELSRHSDEAIHRRQLIRLMVILSLADGPPSLEQMSLMTSFAAALGVEEPAVDVVRHLAKGRILRFRLAFVRHSHLRIYMRNTYRILGSVPRVILAVLIFRGLARENVEMADRFRALDDLPSDSLGNHFYHHCADAGIPFSGEKGGFPIGALFHDFTHVLAGYDTSPEGEMKAAAFQAGFTQDEDDFFTALFAIVIHTAGINMTPFPMPVLLGRIGQGTLAADVLRALQRGAEMKVDLGNGWDFWEDLERPIGAVRERLGVVPMDDHDQRA